MDSRRGGPYSKIAISIKYYIPNFVEIGSVQPEIWDFSGGG